MFYVFYMFFAKIYVKLKLYVFKAFPFGSARVCPFFLVVNGHVSMVFKPHNHSITKMSRNQVYSEPSSSKCLVWLGVLSNMQDVSFVVWLFDRDDPETSGSCFKTRKGSSWFFVLSSCEDLHSWSSVTSTKEVHLLLCCCQPIQNHERHVFDDLLIYLSICDRWFKKNFLFAWIATVKLQS